MDCLIREAIRESGKLVGPVNTGRILIVGALVMLGGCGRQEAVHAKPSAAPLTVNVQRVKLKQVVRNVEAVGSLFPYEEVTVSSEIEGRAIEVKADLGDRVSKGQVLVRVADEEQRYLLAQNEAQLRQALDKLGLKSEGDKVKDLLQTPEVRRAQADLTDADQRFRRMRDLSGQGIGSRQDLDQAQARLQYAQAAYESTLNASRNLVQEVERTRGAVDLQRKKLRDTTIRAPFDGQVKERMVNSGTYLKASTPVFTLVKTDPIRMRISPTVDQAKRTFVVEALIANGRNELKPGSYAKATVHTARSEMVCVVPAKALNYVFGANKLYVVANDKVDEREVKLGDRFGDNVEISEGVKDGEEVAVSQINKLESGMHVQVGLVQ
jgi:multidrug efflux pump subunit AcrA (membrane-fusion protein)